MDEGSRPEEEKFEGISVMRDHVTGKAYLNIFDFVEKIVAKKKTSDDKLRRTLNKFEREVHSS